MTMEKDPGKDSFRIGVFDSGIGGLTVMQQLMHKLPHESIIYFGDTARVPYGGKSPDIITRYSIENTIFLLEKNIKLLVIACNTVDSTALQKLRQIFNIPIIGVIQPGAEKAASVTRNQHIAVLGTKATIQSHAYQKEIQRLLPQSTVIPIACPLLVPLVEEQFIGHPGTHLIIRSYLEPLKRHNIDTLLLGCTHYPLLKELIQQEIGTHVKVVDSASTCADKVLWTLEKLQLEKKQSQKPSYEYYVSDDPEKFKNVAESLFKCKVENVTVHIPGH